MIPDLALFEADVLRFGSLTGVNIVNVAKMTPVEIANVLRAQGTTVGAFCNSGICLAPFR
jgi:hypothetical protein